MWYRKKPDGTNKNILTDTINNKNTVSFLKNYGKGNPEIDILIETRMDNFEIRLYKDTPLHRANFVFLKKTDTLTIPVFIEL